MRHASLLAALGLAGIAIAVTPPTAHAQGRTRAAAGGQGRTARSVATPAATPASAPAPLTPCADTTLAPKARVDACRADVKARQQDAAAHHALGRALAAQEKHDDAAESFERAIALQPTLVAAYTDLGRTLDALEKYREARELLERGVAKNLGEADAHAALAQWLLEAEINDTALVHVGHALKLQPKAARLHDLKGDILWASDRKKDALASYRAAVAADRDYRSGWLGVAMVHRARGERAQAIQAYDQAIRLDRKAAGAYRAKAELLAELKRVPEGTRTMEALVQADPQNDEPHFQLADYLTDRGEAAKALPHYQQAIRLDSTDAVNHHDYGVALLQLAQREPALAEFRTAIRLKPDFGLARGNAFDVLLVLGQNEEALEMAEEWRKVAPKEDAGPHAARGMALRVMGRFGDARKSLDEALERDSTHYGARINRGIILLSDKRLREARADAEVAMRLAPDRSNGYMLAGFVALAEERCADVVRHWDVVNRMDRGWIEREAGIRTAYQECRKRVPAKKK